MGDAAYGGGNTRQAFADAGRRLVAKAPGRPNRTHFPKDDFRIDLDSGSCTCPAGNVTRTMLPTRKRNGHLDRTYSFFRFDAASVPAAAPVRCGGTGHAGRDCIPRKRYCSKPTPYSRVRPLPNTVDAVWSLSIDWPAGPARNPPVPLLRTRQDTVPAVWLPRSLI